MKVLIIVQNLPVPFDRRVWLEARALREDGHQVSVISPKGENGQFQEGYIELEGIHVYRYPNPPQGDGILAYIYEFAYCWIWTALLSIKVLREQGFDVIHACNPPETYFLLGFIYKLFGKKFLFDHHDLAPEMYIAKGGRKGALLFKGLKLLERLTFRTADVVISTNESLRKIAINRGGVPPDRVFVVRTGPDFERLRILPPEPVLKDGFRYLACYLGEMCIQDGVEIILEAACVIRNQFGRDDIKFTLMGGGPDLQRLRQLHQDMGLEGFVEFTGRVSDHDLCRYLSTADVCLDPDPYSEWSNQSTMNKIMEYMAFGKPTVAFDLAENRFSAGKAAIYGKPDDMQEFPRMIVDLLDNEDQRAEMGAFALRRAWHELAWEFSKPILREAYQHLE